MSWQRVRGHDAQVQAFAEVVRQDRLAHAYLFIGPPGIGKRLFAEELSKSLLCENPPEGRLEACDHCPACIQVAAGTHPDFLAVSRPEESAKMPIDTVRELCHHFVLKPARGKGKVAILDDVDDLHDDITNHAAANCFLKTLEEPPPRAVFFLIGTGTDRQLPTVVSRCQVVRFSPLPESTVAVLLREQGVEDAALVQRLARISDGSPGQALVLADLALWEFRRKLITGLLGSRPDGVGLAKEWMHFVEEAGKESAMQRRRASLVVRLLIEFFRDALCVQAGASPRLSEPEDMKLVRDLVESTDADGIRNLLERCLEASEQIERRVQLVLVLEALVEALVRMRSQKTAG